MWHRNIAWYSRLRLYTGPKHFPCMAFDVSQRRFLLQSCLHNAKYMEIYTQSTTAWQTLSQCNQCSLHSIKISANTCKMTLKANLLEGSGQRMRCCWYQWLIIAPRMIEEDEVVQSTHQRCLWSAPYTYRWDNLSDASCMLSDVGNEGFPSKHLCILSFYIVTLILNANSIYSLV